MTNSKDEKRVVVFIDLSDFLPMLPAFNAAQEEELRGIIHQEVVEAAEGESKIDAEKLAARVNDMLRRFA